MVVLSPHYPQGFLPKTATKIAIIDDRRRRGWRLICNLVTEAGGEIVIIPRTVSDRFLEKLGNTQSDIELLRTSSSAADAKAHAATLQKAHEAHFAEVEKMLAGVNGVILPGNEFDVPPTAYGEDSLHPKTHLPSLLDFRFDTERRIAEHALKTSLPMLGVCGGMQLLVTITGGKLVQHLPDALGDRSVHEGYRDAAAQDLMSWMECSYTEFLDDPHKACPVKANHPVTITDETSQFAQIARAQFGTLEVCENPTLGVFSIHHQGAFAEHVNTEVLKITATAADGVVEAVEHKTHPFCIATQFHPEFDMSGIALPLVKALVERCKKPA